MPYPQPDGSLALPATGTGPGVLVLHAWWGLKDTIKVVCTYPDTSHCFFEPNVAQAYNPIAASQAWERTQAFLNRSSTQ